MAYHPAIEAINNLLKDLNARCKKKIKDDLGLEIHCSVALSVNNVVIDIDLYGCGVSIAADTQPPDEPGDYHTASSEKLIQMMELLERVVRQTLAIYVLLNPEGYECFAAHFFIDCNRVDF